VALVRVGDARSQSADLRVSDDWRRAEHDASLVDVWRRTPPLSERLGEIRAKPADRRA
jgi:hypothetical protein